MKMTNNIGALAAMSAESTRAALGLAQRGQVFDLGVLLGNATPRLPADSVVGFLLTQFRTPAVFAANPAMRGNSFSVELVQGSLHQSSHLDALIHAQRHGRVFNNGRVDDLLTDRGWRANGAETIPPIICRAVVIDVAATVGQTPVPDGYAVTLDQLQAAVTQQGVALRPGDAVLIRTRRCSSSAAFTLWKIYIWKTCCRPACASVCSSACRSRSKAPPARGCGRWPSSSRAGTPRCPRSSRIFWPNGMMRPDARRGRPQAPIRSGVGCRVIGVKMTNQEQPNDTQ